MTHTIGEMKAVVVTGDRHATRDPWESLIDDILSLQCLDLVIVGNAQGVDYWTHGICEDYMINHIVVPAMWDRDGKSAGPRRNRAMLNILQTLGDHGHNIGVLAFHDDIWNSKGTKNCVESAYGMGIPYTVYTSSDVRVE